MILKEIAVERFTFSCASCGHTWVVDFDVQHVEDGHGHLHDYFSRNGQPCADPTAPRSVICSACRTTHVQARSTARRSTPAVNVGAPEAPSANPSARLTNERDNAPILSGDQTPANPTDARFER